MALRWSPRLFAALGAGFQADATVRDGVHLRWSLDPRMGLPRLPRDKGFEIAFSRTQEGSITRVDLFNPSARYPVRTNKGVLPAGPSTVRRDGNRLSFMRPLGGTEWLSYWRYRHHRGLVETLMLGREREQKALLDHLDGVMSALDPIGPVASSRIEDAVAVDVRFLPPGQGAAGTRSSSPQSKGSTIATGWWPRTGSGGFRKSFSPQTPDRSRPRRTS